MSSLRWLFFFFKQKTAYEMRISDWSSDVCSSDLGRAIGDPARRDEHGRQIADAERADDAGHLVAADITVEQRLRRRQRRGCGIGKDLGPGLRLDLRGGLRLMRDRAGRE